MTEAITRAAESAQAVTTPVTFDFAAAVLDRSYPEIKVPVYLNEKSIQRLLRAKKAQASLELRIAKSKEPTVEQANRLEQIDNDIAAIIKELQGEQYLVTIRGIAPEDQIKIEDRSFEEIPREYVETAHPMSGATIKTEVQNDKRDELFATLLRQAHLVSVTAPNGAIDKDFSDPEKVRTTWSHLPLQARIKVDEAINESTIAVDFYREIADEVF